MQLGTPVPPSHQRADRTERAPALGGGARGRRPAQAGGERRRVHAALGQTPHRPASATAAPAGASPDDRPLGTTTTARDDQGRLQRCAGRAARAPPPRAASRPGMPIDAVAISSSNSASGPRRTPRTGRAGALRVLEQQRRVEPAMLTWPIVQPAKRRSAISS